MQKPEVLWWGGQRGSWCHGIVEFLTQGFTHRMHANELQDNGAIVVVKADWLNNQEELDKLNILLLNLRWVLLLVTANEEGHLLWKCDPLVTGIRIPYTAGGAIHGRLWLQTPHRHQECHRALPWGWTPDCFAEVQPKKDLDCSFAGQITHRRRWDLMRGFTDVAIAGKSWEFHGSDGFAKGLSQAEYYTLIERSKVVPCPSGPFTVDSFRVCEALQLGAIPILDAQSPRGPYIEYWERVFGKNYPLPVAYEWGIDFNLIVEDVLKNFAELQDNASFWWTCWKDGLEAQLMDDLHELGAM